MRASACTDLGYQRGAGSRAAALIVSLVLLIIPLVVGAAPAQAVSSTGPSTEDTVSADPLPTVQIDGVAWTQLISGNTVYVGGSFSNARPAGAAAGTNLTSRSNLLAYNLADGKLNTTWAPSANGQVRGFALSPDGSRLYVVGEFTSINGTSRSRVAALNPTTGAVIGGWAPVANGSVTGIVATDSAVYIAGLFTSVNGTTRTKVAAVSAATGALLPFNADVQGGYGARAIVLSPDKSKVVIGGSFTSVNGSTNPGRGLAALDATTGESLPWLINSVIRNGDEAAAILSLSSDGDSVYGTAFDYGGTAQDGFEGTFRADWSDGKMEWIEDCHGDTYDAVPVGDVIYTASHAHYCGNIGGFPQTNPWGYQHSIAFTKSATGPIIKADPLGYRSFAGYQAPEMLHWYPKWVPGTYTGMSQAAFSVATNGQYVVYGGEFPKVMGSSQQGLVRFALKSIAPNKVGPQVQGTDWSLSLVSYRAGEIRLSWQANYDPDDSNLTYYVYRQDKGTSVPIYTTTADSNFWTRPLMSFIDKTVTPGTTYAYKVRVYDPHGNLTSTGDWLPVVATTDGAATAYNDVVLNSQPTYYWPMSEASGSKAYDWATGNNINLNSVTRGVTGPNQTEASLATRFSGGSTSRGATQASTSGATEFSIEAWFSTTSRTGGKIVGFGSSASGDSSSYDRHIYMSNSGQVTFGVYPGSVATLTSVAGYNDGRWHHVVATMDGSGLKLYLDDKLVGSRSDVTTAQDYSGYWRIGGDNQNGWPSTGSSKYFSGSISDVAIYSRALTRDDVDSHWIATGRASTIPAAPADLYGKAVFAQDPQIYWRLGEMSGATAADSGRNGNTGTYRGAVSRGESGALERVSDTAIRVAGGGYLSSDSSFSPPALYSIEAWFKTTSSTGGKIVGFGDAQSGNSANYDRHVYMTADGLIHFGVYDNGAAIISSSTALNNGQWHQVVAQQSAAGMQLYVDGEMVDQNSVGAAQPYTGYWRVGGDSTWADASYFTGSIDEVAIYGALLSRDEIEAHHQLGRTGLPNQAPTASFTAAVTDLAVEFDGSASSDADGRIAGYSWDFGDGSPILSGTNPKPSHSYTTPGTYQVTLTVTDNQGATEDIVQPVTVTAPNIGPAAAFSVSVTDLVVAFDGSASADPDGSIVSYAWDFGDGSPVVT
ncbi:MAG: LamG-like jellyroll fold domain-containing protein, partial [Candidatus Saccharimonadales bacterium]